MKGDYMKKVCYVLVVAVFALLLVTGCGKKEEVKPIVGTWVYEANAGYYYTFNKDNSCSDTRGEEVLKCTYQDDGTRVTITYEGSNEPTVFEYAIEKDVLTLTDAFGSKILYNKKK